MKWRELARQLTQGDLTEHLRPVYGGGASDASQRLRDLMDGCQKVFNPNEQADVLVFSAPGRTELGGNHTDHQKGCALAASVDLDTIACVLPNRSSVIRVKSRYHRMAQTDLTDLSIHPEESGSSMSLVRGVAARLVQMGYAIGGFDAYTTTRVPRGGGLSSSAVFEILLGEIMNRLYCGGVLTPLQNAQIGQYAENRYFGKPCGLIDQLSCAGGGVVFADFADLEHPAICRLEVDCAAYGYALCLVDSRASHAPLLAEYAAIPKEMGQVAACFGKEVLGEVPIEDFRRAVPQLRQSCGDRAVLRAFHFYGENQRVKDQKDALARGDFTSFLRLVRASGRSSFMYLQNVSTYKDSRHQGLALLLAAAEDLLQGQGACRVHGGGFAGTIQAFVPLERVAAFAAAMDGLAGEGSCHVAHIRPTGATLLAG